MSTGRIFDASGGIISQFHYDHDGDMSIVQRVQDVEPIIENNKRLRAEDKGYSSSRELRRVASIPLVVIERWMQEDGVNFLALGKQDKSAYLRKKLNDPDNKAWRNSDGAL